MRADSLRLPQSVLSQLVVDYIRPAVARSAAANNSGNKGILVA